MRRLTSSGDHYAWSIFGSTRLCLDRRGEMHGHGNRADHTVRVIHQSRHLSHIRLADQVDDASQPCVTIGKHRPALHEQGSIFEMIDYLLVTRRVPPLCRKIVLAARHNDPEASCYHPGQLIHLGHPLSFLLRQMDIARKGVRTDFYTEPFRKGEAKRVDEMIRQLITHQDKRIMTFDCLHRRIIILELRDIRIILPKLRIMRSSVYLLRVHFPDAKS